MKDWLKFTTTKNATTGVETVTYDYTPQEFIERLQREQDVVYTTTKACSDCFYFQPALTQEMLEKHARECIHYHRCMECIGSTIARCMRKQDVPDSVGCYTFFYKHWQKNMYIRAAIEAHLLAFYDVTKLPTLKDIGGTIILPNWYY